MKKILVIGSLNMDFVLEVDHIPVVGETVLSKSLQFVPGGKGANQAFCAGKLGGKVSMLGAVGKDQHGDALLRGLSGAGVNISPIRQLSGKNTGVALIGVNAQGNNSIIISQGANLEVTPRAIDENIALLTESDIVVFQLEIPLETVLYGAKKAKELGKTVILDPAPAVENLPKELFSCLDIIKPNEIELGTLLGDPNAKESLSDSCRRLKELGVKNVIVTLGEEGAFLLEESGGETRFPAVSFGPAVDTTAAGDSFTAALALGLSQGMNLKESVSLSIRVGGMVVTRKGAQTSIPSREEVFGPSL